LGKIGTSEQEVNVFKKSVLIFIILFLIVFVAVSCSDNKEERLLGVFNSVDEAKWILNNNVIEKMRNLEDDYCILNLDDLELSSGKTEWNIEDLKKFDRDRETEAINEDIYNAIKDLESGAGELEIILSEYSHGNSY
jgi:hypothetical protein